MDIFDKGNFLHPDEPVQIGDFGYRFSKKQKVKCNFSLLGTDIIKIVGRLKDNASSVIFAVI